MSDRDHYVEKARARMDQWDAEIDKAKAKLDEAEADEKIEYQKQLDNMRAQRADAEAKLKEIAEAGDDAWDDVRAGFERAWDEISGAFQNAKSRFK